MDRVRISKKDKLAALSASKAKSNLAPKSKYEGCIFMGEAESAQWAWDHLWSAGGSDYVKLKILDTIRIEHGNISSWIFTMNTDGFIKSRSKNRFNLPSVFDKCVDTSEVVQTPDTLLKAHYVQLSSLSSLPNNDNTTILKWENTKKGELNDIFGSKSEKPAALICYNSIEESSRLSFAEITLELNTNNKASISQKPKVLTQLYYQGHSIPLTSDEKWQINNFTDKDKAAFPPKKLTCVNKTTCNNTEIFINHLKKVLEDRSKSKIDKLIVVVALEGVDDGEKVVWLHHVKQVILADNNNKSNINNIYDDSSDPYAIDYDRRSNATSDISGSNASTTTYLRRQQAICSGDFCECPLDEEGIQAALKLAPDGTFKQDLARARARNNITIDGNGHGTGTGGSPIKDSDGNALINNDHSAINGDSSRTEKHTGIIDTGLKKKVNRKIPMKSIALCRKEAESWELLGRSGHYDDVTMPWSNNVFEWWFGVGKNLAQHKNSGATVPISSAYNVGKSILGMKTINEVTDDAIKRNQNGNGNGNDNEEYGTLGDVNLDDAEIDPITGAPILGKSKSKKNKLSSNDSVGGSSMHSNSNSHSNRSALSKNIMYDLAGDNSYTGQTRRSVGQMSWYYSEVKVCQTCYQTYRDIDRRREAMQLKQLKAMRKKQQLQGADQQEYDRQIEKKIFNQKKMASRLSQPLIRESNSADGNSPKRNSNSNSYGANKVVGASNGVLPPLPWQLRNGENAKNYEDNKFSTTIVRNIRSKAQGMARAVQQDKLMERVEMKQYRQKMMTGGMLDENSQMLDESSQLQSYYAGTTEQWQEYTGQSRMESEMKMASMNQHRKVIGGLGENRPKGHSKNFDTAKLMHPWQRDAEEIAKKVRKRGKDNNNSPTGYGMPNEGAKDRRRAAIEEKETQKRAAKGGGGINYGGKPISKMISPTQTHSQSQKQTRFFPDESMDGMDGMGGLGQGSMVSQLTMDASMANYTGNVNVNGNRNGNYSSHKQKAMQESSQASLEGLDDEEWIQAIMVKGKGNVPVSDLLDANGSIMSFGGNENMNDNVHGNKSKVNNNRNRSGARTPKGSLRVSFDGPIGGSGSGSNGNSPTKMRSNHRPSTADTNGDSDDDDDDDGAIGWSPFVIPQ